MNTEELLAAMQGDGAEKPVKVEGHRWGEVYIRIPTMEEAESRKRRDEDAEDEQATNARAVAALLCDETGKRLLDPDNDAHIAVLQKRRSPDLVKIILAARDQGN